MKFLKVLSATAILLAVQTIAAQNPVISQQYSNAEITQKIQDFHAAHAHEVVPPANLQTKFMSDFPKASETEWETANEIYEVEFNVGVRDFKALYDHKGNLLSVTEEIRVSELPSVVKNAAETKYPKYNIESVDKIRRGTETFYKIELERGESEVKIVIQSDGQIISERFDY